MVSPAGRRSGRPRRVAELVLGGLLVAMAAGQASGLDRFPAALVDYRVLPPGSEQVVARVVVAAEAAAGVLLLAGWARRVGAVLAVVVASGWAVLALGAFTRNVRLGNCGCFGVHLAQPLRWWVLVEDAEFVLLGLWVAHRAFAARPPGSVRGAQRHDRGPQHQNAGHEQPRVAVPAKQPHQCGGEYCGRDGFVENTSVGARQ